MEYRDREASPPAPAAAQKPSIIIPPNPAEDPEKPAATPAQTPVVTDSSQFRDKDGNLPSGDGLYKKMDAVT